MHKNTITYENFKLPPNFNLLSFFKISFELLKHEKQQKKKLKFVYVAVKPLFYLFLDHVEWIDPDRILLLHKFSRPYSSVKLIFNSELKKYKKNYTKTCCFSF